MSKDYLEALNDLMGFIEERDNYFENKWINEDYETIKQALLELKRLDSLLKLPSEQSSSHFTYKDKNLVCMQLTRYGKLMDAFLELQSIKEAKPSEALECLGIIYDGYCSNCSINVKRFKTIRQALIKAQEMEKELKEQKELLDILKNKPFILQKIFEEKGLKNQKEFDHKYFWGTITEEEEFKIMRWLDEKEN